MSGHERIKIHPLTWLAAALLLPLACWDVRQAEHDVHLRHTESVQRLHHPTATQRAGAISRLSPFVASREAQRTGAITQEP